MRWFDFITMLILSISLIIGIYLLWLNLPQEQIEYQKYQSALEQNLSSKNSQFYPNMRYPESEISFFLLDTCAPEKKSDFRNAVKILEEKTILNFIELQTEDAQINVTCSNISPEPEQAGHFIAGEGGPSLFLNTTRYAIIVSGEVALYRPETCETPQIALHEILHALGFDHNNNKKSIMHPITDCGQTLDTEITDEINRLYSEPSLADLTIESIDANKTGRYLNFGATIANQGLKNAQVSTLEIIVSNKVIKEFEIGEIALGAKRRIAVTNLRLPSSSDAITLSIKTLQEEITQDNNIAEISPVANQ